MLNRFEAIAIFASIAVFAVALALMRFSADQTFSSVTNRQQGAAIVAVTDAGLKSALKDAVTSTGALQKLIIDDIRKGTGREVRKGDTVTVDYIGSTKDGIQFDNTYARGEPFTFTVGAGQVIQGWEEGIVGMRVGGTRILVIPPHLAYGDRQIGPIPKQATLVFAIELHRVE